MILHIIKSYYRSFLHSKSVFVINLFGLSSALACTLLIYLWINDEMSFDKFHEKDVQLFQVMENIHNGNEIITREATPIGMSELLLETMPEVEYAATVTPMAWFPRFIIEHNGGRLKNEGKFVGEDFFNIFSYPLLFGDNDQVLQGRYSIVISERLAKTLFGSAGNAIGKTIAWELGHFKQGCQVTGVFEDVPYNSQDQFDLLLPIDLLAELMNFATHELGPPGPSSFVILKKETDHDAFNGKLSKLMASRTGQKKTDFFVVSYSSKYLNGNFDNGQQAGGRIQYVKLFAIIALVILAIACINFMNLTTAKASRRLKEVGIKKAMGAGRRNLIFQYLGESTVMALIALIMAILFVKILLPQFNQITGKQLVFVLDPNAVTVCMGIALTTGLLAGSYPALYLSGFKPARILKGQLKGSFAELLARKGLVVFQFTISIISIVAVLVIYRQMAYVQTSNLGYNKNNLIYFEIEGKVIGNYEAFIAEIKNIPGIANASAMFGNVVGTVGHGVQVDYNNIRLPLHWLQIDYDMIETLGIEMQEGRTFSRQFNDSARVIFNQAAIDAMDIQDPVGKIITFGDEQVEIIGVTKDFHVRSLHEKITPLAFRLVTESLWNIFVRLEEGREKDALNQLKAMYQKFNPGFALDYQFVDQKYQSQYISEARVASLSTWFAALGVVVSCLGLFGLAAFSAERRTKEIGIRKVLGSTASGITYLLCKDFIKLVFIAVLISLPLSYYLMNEWLQRFAYAIDLEVWFFVTAGLLAIVIAFIATGSQAVKASMINPSECLRNE